MNIGMIKRGEQPGGEALQQLVALKSGQAGQAGPNSESVDTELGRTASLPTPWGGVWAMALCVFVLIASEFMPVSLLTPMAHDLAVSEGYAGLGIAISGAFAVITSLSILVVAGSLNRKTLLLGLTVLMAISGLVVALAPNPVVYMAGRALIGMAVGGFWSLSAATAMRLVPIHQVPRALAIFNGGNALATVIAFPLGSYLESIFGWRGAFLGLVPLALLALIWQWGALPSMPVKMREEGSGSVFRLLKNPLVALGMLAVSAFFMGQFALFTYLRPFLESAAHASVSTLSLVLLLMGVSGFVGTAAISSFLAWDFNRTMIGAPMLMAVTAVALTFFADHIVIVATLLCVWGLVATAVPVGWGAWLARTLPQDAEAGGGLMVAVIQFAIALGSSLGGLFFDSYGYRTTFWASAVTLLLAASLKLLTVRFQTSQSD